MEESWNEKHIEPRGGFSDRQLAVLNASRCSSSDTGKQDKTDDLYGKDEPTNKGEARRQ